MSVHPRVVHKRRATITALPLYYSGFLLKKNSKEKDFKRVYGELRGTTLFLYKDETQDAYLEKVELEQLKSMELESPFLKKGPTIFSLTQTEEVQLRMDNPETGEEWRGYILTVIKRAIPSKLQLLPGQILLLQEVLSQEMRRNPPGPRPPLPPRPAFLLSASSSTKDQSTPEVPACFLNVTRQEAEKMLEANPEYGGIILRPSTLANNYALTLRQLMTSGAVMKNYRVSAMNSGFVIELEKPVAVSTLNDVLKYFLEKTEYRLQPYMPSQPYDTRIDVSATPESISSNSGTLKAIPKAQVAPMQRSMTKEELLPPPAKPDEGDYVVPDNHCPADLHGNIAQMDGELKEVLKLRREIRYSASREEENTTYENQSGKKNSSVQWSM